MEPKLNKFYKRFLIILSVILVVMLSFAVVKMASAVELGYELDGFGSSAANGTYCPIEQEVNGYPVFYNAETAMYLWQGYTTLMTVDSVLQIPVTGAVYYYTDSTFAAYPDLNWYVQSGANPVGTAIEIDCEAVTPVALNFGNDMSVLNFVAVFFMFVTIVAGIVKLFMIFRKK